MHACNDCKKFFSEGTDTSPETDARFACPYCHSLNTVKEGGWTGQTWFCKDCKHSFTESTIRKFNAADTSEIEYSNNEVHVVEVSRMPKSLEAIIKERNINMDEWEVAKYKVKSSEGYRKDRKVSWQVVDGKVIEGAVEDSGKMLIVPLYSTEALFVKKLKIVEARLAVEEMLADAREHAPEYKQLSYPEYPAGMLYEVCIPDIHFGRLTWAEESGDDYDVKIARKMATAVLEKLLAYSKNYPVERILLPIGNDFFNVNSKLNTTVKGTPQQEDTRWAKTFRLGRKLAVEMIDQCSAIAPVDVMMIAGNHDTEKLFYMGDALECWYNNNPNVKVNNFAKTRKYYSYGKVLLGLTHGDIKIDKLVSIMPLEEPHLWGQSKFREWHVGHVHHLYRLNNDAEEMVGVVVRSLRSLVPADAWTFDHGLVGAVKAAESFLWDKEQGLIAQFTALP